MATNENVTIRQCTMGRNPHPAAPRPMPVSAASEMGVERTRAGPNSAPGSPVKSVAMVKTRGSRRISSATASSRAFWKVSSRMGPPSSLREEVDQEILRVGEGARLGEGHRRVEIGGDPRADPGDLVRGEQAQVDRVLLEPRDGVARLPGGELGGGAGLRGRGGAHGVKAPAIRLALDEARAVAAPRPADRLAGGA